MSKKFPQLTPAWVKKNIPAVPETKDFLAYLDDAFDKLEDVLTALDNDEISDLGQTDAISKVHAEVVKRSKDLLTHSWKDSKTKKIPDAIKELESTLKLARNVAGSALADSAKESAKDLLNIEITVKKLHKQLEEGKTAGDAIAAKVKQTTAAIAKATDEQKKTLVTALDTAVKKLSPKAFNASVWTATWRDAKMQLSKAKLSDKKKAEGFELVDEGSTALAKQIKASEDLQKTTEAVLTKLSALVAAKKK